VTDREELHLLSGAYALNALDADEKARFESYLLTSEETRAEVASLSDTAVLLGLSTEPVTPPADLRDRLMAQIALTPQLAPLPASRATLTAVPPMPPMLPESPEATRRQTEHQQTEHQQTERQLPEQQMPEQQDASAAAVHAASLGTPSPATTKAAARWAGAHWAGAHWYTRPASILIAAAAAVALFVGGNILGLSAGNESQRQASAISAIVSASDYQQAKANVAGGGTATFVWSMGLKQSAVVIDKLPELAAGKTYALWYIDSKSKATPAGIFNAASSGTTVSVLAGSMGAGDTIGITIEPSGGSKAPTTAPIVAVPSA
jgi:anti-sigma-K factor RskA